MEEKINDAPQAEPAGTSKVEPAESAEPTIAEPAEPPKPGKKQKPPKKPKEPKKPKPPKKPKEPKKPMTKAERKEYKKLKKVEKAEKKKAKKAQKQQAQKAKSAAPKQAKTPKQKKPKLTKEEKNQLKQEKGQTKKDKAQTKQDKKQDKVQAKQTQKLDKTRKKVEKIRAKAQLETELLRLKKENKAEEKQTKKERQAEAKRIKKELRDEIKLAKKDLPKHILRKVIISLVIVVLLVSGVFILNDRNVGPFGLLPLPEIPAPVKSAAAAVADSKPVAAVRSFNPVGAVKSILPTKTNPDHMAEQTVGNMFEAFIALNYTEAGNYMDMSGFTLPVSYIEPASMKMLMDATFDKLQYSIVPTPTETGNTEAAGAEAASEPDPATEEAIQTDYEVTVSVTAIGFRPMMAYVDSDYLELIFNNAISNTSLNDAESESRVASLLSEYVEKYSDITVTNQVTVTVSHPADEEWIVIPDSNLLDALFGGAITAGGNYYDPNVPVAPDASSELDAETVSEH